MTKQRKLVLFLIFFLILQLSLQLATLRPPRYYLNLSPSVPLGLYKLIPLKGQLRVGELVIFEVPKPARPYVHGRGWLPEGWLLMKKVGALPGDKVTITNDLLKINGLDVGPIYELDSEGKPLPQIRDDFHVPARHFLPVATGIQNSFDGRYFGPVPVSLIKGKAVAIIAFKGHRE